MFMPRKQPMAQEQQEQFKNQEFPGNHIKNKSKHCVGSVSVFLQNRNEAKFVSNVSTCLDLFRIFANL